MTSSSRPCRLAPAMALLAVATVVGWFSPAAPATAAPRPGIVYGVSLGDTLPGLKGDALDARLADLASLGIGSLRVDLDWENIQPDSPTAWRWDDFDRVVKASSAHGLTLLPIVGYTPPWARRADCSGPSCPPADPARFAAFVGAAVHRYAPMGVTTWELWNEPNQGGSWLPAADAGAYAALVKATVPAMRKASGGLTILSGGLAPTESRNGNLEQLDYLRQLCAAGGVGPVDAVGYHPYTFPVPPSEGASWSAWSKMSSTATSMVSILKGCGAGGKRLWATEYGAPTGGPGLAATATDYKIGAGPDHVDEGAQARMATESVSEAAGDPNIAALYWYTYKDRGTSKDTIENFFGLRRADGSAKPAWDAYRTAVRAQAGRATSGPAGATQAVRANPLYTG
jgi:hypothetical protein